MNDGLDSHTFDRDSIPFYRQGVREVLNVHNTPSMIAALKPFTGAERQKVMTALVGWMANINRLVAVGKTSLSPMFAPFNFARDVQTANINLPKGVSRVRFNWELMRPDTWGAVGYNVLRELVGKDPSGGYAGAREAGAFIDHRAYTNLDPISKDVDYMFRPQGVSGWNARRRKWTMSPWR